MEGWLDRHLCMAYNSVRMSHVAGCVGTAVCASLGPVWVVAQWSL